MRRPRLSLTLRIALTGILSALVPFLAGLAFIAAAPEQVIERRAQADASQTLRTIVIQMTSERSRLATAVANIPDTSLRAAAQRPVSRDKLATQIATTLGTAPGSVSVRLRRAKQPLPPAGPVTAQAHLVGVGDLIVTRGIDDAWLRSAVARPESNALIIRTRGAKPALVLAATHRKALRGDVRVTGSKLTWDSPPEVVDTADIPGLGDVQIVAFERGSHIDLLLQNRGSELQIALLLLLASGVLGGLGAALVMNRNLGRVAIQAERMAAGSYDDRMQVIGRDAGARVATSLNDLAGDVQQRIATLENAFSRLDTTIASIDDGIAMWDSDGSLAVWNAGMVRLTGIKRSGVDATHGLGALLRGELVAGRRRLLIPLADSGRSLAVDLVVRRIRDGGTLQVLRDATPAISIQQARENFMITAAHELRTPLASIMGFAATLGATELDLTDEMKAMSIDNILEASQRLEQTIARFFEGSLLLTEGVDVSITPVEARELLTLVERDSRTVTASLGLKVDDPGRLELLIDRDVASRALRDLIDNACKYGDGPIEITAWRDGLERGCIEVRDHGPGIEASLREAVFDPFFRIDPHMRTDVGGVGMGLYSARRKFEAMGGRLELDDPASGSGLVCRVSLPATSPGGPQPMPQGHQPARGR